MVVAAPIHRRPGLTLYRYVALETLRPTVFALLALTTVVLTQDLLGFTALVINRGLSTGVVSLIAFYKAVPLAALMFPFAVLLGCLAALGRMGADLEILALESLGVTAARLVWPYVALTGALTALSLVLSLAVAPWTERSLDREFERISREKPWAEIRQGTVSRFGAWQLEAREVNARGDRLDGILLWMPDIGQTIFAQQGRIDPVEGGGISIVMTNGSVVFSPAGGARMLRFRELTTRMPDSEALMRDIEDRLAGLTLGELREEVRNFVPGELRRVSRAEIELHRRFSMAIATLVFGILAVPLFLVRTRFSRSGGVVMGLLCTVSYYGLIQLGEGLAQAEHINVVTAAWLPNTVLSLFAAALIIRVRREGVLGHTFDRPQDGARRSSADSKQRSPRRLPLPRYIAARFAYMALLSFAVLLVGYLLIDIMERLEWFTRYNATGLEVLSFYAARIVLLASRVVPMSLLVATAMTVSLFAVEGELLGMRACGIPALKAMAPILFLTALIVPADTVLENVLVPKTNALADEIKRTDIKGIFGRKPDERRKAAVWYRSGNQVLEASYFDPDRGLARDLAIYELGSDRLPVSRIDAPLARHIGRGRWRLVEPTRIEMRDGRVFEVKAARFADLGETVPAEVDTMHLSVAEIAKLIEETEADEGNPIPLRVDFHQKLSQPLACILLPAVVLLFAVGGPPFPGPAQTLLVSAIVGISYILLTGVARSLGYGGAVPPTVGGWGSVLIFLGAAGFLGIRLVRRG